MIRRVALVSCLAVVLAGSAAADTRGGALGAALGTVKARQEVELQAAPRGDGKVIETIRPGQSVDVLGRRGRWVEVRFDGRHGWVLRSALGGQMPEARGQSTASEVTAGGDALAAEDGESGAARSAPSPKAGKAGKTGKAGKAAEAALETETAKPAKPAKPARATTAAKAAKATKVAKPAKPASATRTARAESAESAPGGSFSDRSRRGRDAEDGDLDNGIDGESDEIAEDADDDAEVYDVPVLPGLAAGPTIAARARRPARPPASPRVALHAGLGYGKLAMTRSATEPDGAALTSFAAPSAELGLDLGGRLGAVFVGLDADLAVTERATVRHQTATGELGDASARSITATGAALIGVGDEVRATARLGYHYDRFRVAQVDNAARLPSELVHGATVGAGLATRAAGLDLALTAEVLVVGEQRQGAGLEDGAAGRPLRGLGQAEVSYDLADHVALVAAYRVALTRTRFSGPSIRDDAASDTRRSDLRHSGVVGVALAY